MTVLHGYPASAGAGLLAVAGVVAATAVSWRVLGARPSRTVSRAALVVAVAALVTGTGLAAAPGAAPAVPHDHEYRDARTAGEPTRRFTLTAGTATVSVSGRDVAAWAFNGQVPGPELTATVGDVLEVTLRNRDIARGVTLHWHGYDVPNGQDGVPGRDAGGGAARTGVRLPVPRRPGRDVLVPHAFGLRRRRADGPLRRPGGAPGRR